VNCEHLGRPTDVVPILHREKSNTNENIYSYLPTSTIIRSNRTQRQVALYLTVKKDTNEIIFLGSDEIDGEYSVPYS